MNAVLVFLTLEMLGNQFAELDRFPHHESAKLNYQFADANVRYLEKELGWVDDGGIVAWSRCDTPLSKYSRERAHLLTTLEISRYCRDCWRELALARCGKERMDHTDNLKRLLGDAAYAAGQMPPPAPWWRMRKAGR